MANMVRPPPCHAMPCTARSYRHCSASLALYPCLIYPHPNVTSNPNLANVYR